MQSTTQWRLVHHLRRANLNAAPPSTRPCAQARTQARERSFASTSCAVQTQRRITKRHRATSIYGRSRGPATGSPGLHTKKRGESCRCASASRATRAWTRWWACIAIRSPFTYSHRLAAPSTRGWQAFPWSISSSLCGRASLSWWPCRASPTMTERRSFASARTRPPGTSGCTSFAALMASGSLLIMSLSLLYPNPPRRPKVSLRRPPQAVHAKLPWTVLPARMKFALDFCKSRRPVAVLLLPPPVLDDQPTPIGIQHLTLVAAFPWNWICGPFQRVHRNTEFSTCANRHHCSRECFLKGEPHQEGKE